ncbi:MAG: hypothetical protein JO050_02045 [Acidimicrobiia bacterium]|nr:hypothetical protein [Acidimicrobiia bacterium]
MTGVVSAKSVRCTVAVVVAFELAARFDPDPEVNQVAVIAPAAITAAATAAVVSRRRALPPAPRPPSGSAVTLLIVVLHACFGSPAQTTGGRHL